MPDYLNFIRGTVTISYTFAATKRRYASPNAFAGFIGALATNETKIANQQEVVLSMAVVFQVQNMSMEKV